MGRQQAVRQSLHLNICQWIKRQKYKGEPLVDDCPDTDMCVGAPHAFPLLDFYSRQYRALTQRVTVYLSASQTTVNIPLILENLVCIQPREASVGGSRRVRDGGVIRAGEAKAPGNSLEK